MFIASG